MSDTLLVATDLSIRSDRAIERAALLAADRELELTVLHVIDDDLPATLADQLAKAAEIELASVAAGLHQRHAIRVVPLVEFGKPHRKIIDVAERISAQLLVLGTHREDAVSFRGTTVERVIRDGPFPCIVAVQRPERPYNEIVAGVDFSAHARRAVEFALDFFPSVDLALVHAYHIPYRGLLYAGRSVSKSDEIQITDQVEKEFTAFLAGFKDLRHGITCTSEEGLPHAVVRNQIARLQADLVIVGTHGRTGLPRAILGSVAENLLSNPPCDIAVVKAW